MTAAAAAAAARVSPRTEGWLLHPPSLFHPSLLGEGGGRKVERRLGRQPPPSARRGRAGGGGGGERGGESGVKPLSTHVRTRADLILIFWPLFSVPRGVLQQRSLTPYGFSALIS